MVIGYRGLVYSFIGCYNRRGVRQLWFT